MRQVQRRVVSALLLEFTKLNEAGRSVFISSMNEFLMASHNKQKNFVEQWGVESKEIKSASSSAKGSKYNG